MKNLLNFLARYNNLIIFLILEGIALYFLTTNNNYHNGVINKGLRGLTNGIEARVNNAKAYFMLREINQNLANENSALKNRIERISLRDTGSLIQVIDTIYNQKYFYSPVIVINNSINRQKNFFTINRGIRHGLNTEMAVTSSEGIAGVIVGCSSGYSVVMSVLNLDFRISARLKTNSFFGSLTWDGRDPAYAVLNEIPQHVTVAVGDTVETTGFSAIFPEGVIIGTVTDFEKPGGDFYNIKVRLATDFRRLRFVDVIRNKEKTEQVELENLFQ